MVFVTFMGAETMKEKQERVGKDMQAEHSKKTHRWDSNPPHG